LKFRN